MSQDYLINNNKMNFCPIRSQIDLISFSGCIDILMNLDAINNNYDVVNVLIEDDINNMLIVNYHSLEYFSAIQLNYDYYEDGCLHNIKKVIVYLKIEVL